MSGEETIEARQTNEFEALHAIYGEDLKDFRTQSAWNKWQPLNLSITLTPQQGSSGTQEIYVKTDLHVICSESYPNKPPKIFLENAKGLPQTILQQLLNELESKANKLKGEEMIFQLTQYVQEFLHAHNKPTYQTKSFYDEMLKRQKEKEQQVLLLENEKRMHVMQEVQKRQEMLKSEYKIRRESRLSSENSNEDENGDNFRRLSATNRKYNNSSSENSDDLLCEHKGSVVINFSGKDIQRGRCLKHKPPNHVIFSGIDKDTGEMVIISQWTIEFNSGNDFIQIQRQITSIEQEFNYLIKLKHQNLGYYQHFKYEDLDNKIIIYVVKEFVNGCNCLSLFINQSFNIEIQFLKHIAHGVLSALDYLHRNNVVHKDIRTNCVYISDKGLIKLTNHSIHKRLSDLLSQGHGCYGKKEDVLQFGRLLLWLLKGEEKDDNEIPHTIPTDLYDFLNRCLAKDDKDRYTAAQLLRHSFFRTEIQTFSPKHKPDGKEIERNASPENISTDLLGFTQNLQNGQSRINNEFEFLQHLGKGAFGDVIKVRNKLDGGYYAIKRIQLNPKNKQLNKKIVREVKLLSRLNHENVVRYYNSWIETTTIKADDSDLSTSSTGFSVESARKMIRKDDLNQAPKNVEVSITYDSKSQPVFATDDDSSDEDSPWGVYRDSDSDDGIEFERDSKYQSEESSQSNLSTDISSATPHSDGVKQIDFMYIQMEFCEKSTLRNAIDNNLYLDEDRMWRLFREIVEGLAHIHQQGMIHRDLKPVNIFLDFEDHVKIGDFGLATTNFKSKSEFFTKSALESEREEMGDESKTGLVGTALYVAPEINTASKSVYNQKVDIYSLGIILFEMCYHPLQTNMERIKILLALRSKEIIFPEDFPKNKSKQEFLIRWLLNHDTTKRPTSQELLQSEHVPPPVLEECELRELVRHTLSNPQLKGYKYLIASCFQQSLTPAQDITYDRDPAMLTAVKPLQLYEFVRQKMVTTFKQHGGQNLATPLLMPKGKYYDSLESCVKLMTHFGSIVTLPHDLRVPFARYVAWNNITNLRRYSVERVYREKKVFGFQPRELYECAFDIIYSIPTASFMPEAEILYIIYKIINQLPVIKNKHFTIRLNHTSLVKSILFYCGIKDKHEEVLKRIAEIKEKRESKYEMQTYFIKLGLPDNNINMLISFFNSEIEIEKAMNHFQMITRKKSGDASQLAKQGLQELRSIVQIAEAYGVNYETIVCPGLVYNVEHYSGMFCQFVCELKKKHKHGNLDVIAAGGRYDSLIAYYRNIIQSTFLSRDSQIPSAVGISISLDKLVQAIQKERENQEDELKLISNSFVEVVVCSFGSKPLIKEKTKILNMLWSAGISCFLIDATNHNDIQEQVNDLKVPHVVILKDNEQGVVTIRSWTRDRFQEKKCQISQLVEYMQHILNVWNDSNVDLSSSSSSQVVSRSESKLLDKTDQNEVYVEVLFITSEKLSSNARKRYDNQIRSQLDGLFRHLTGNVVVLGISTESSIVRSLAAYLDFDSEYAYQKSVAAVIERHQRHKKYLNELADEIYDQKSKRSNPTIVLYSLSDTFYKTLL